VRNQIQQRKFRVCIAHPEWHSSVWKNRRYCAKMDLAIKGQTIDIKNVYIFVYKKLSV
jgi:hypothetical protein